MSSSSDGLVGFLTNVWSIDVRYIYPKKDNEIGYLIKKKYQNLILSILILSWSFISIFIKINIKMNHKICLFNKNDN
jgi:hypothetical protein